MRHPRLRTRRSRPRTAAIVVGALALVTVGVPIAAAFLALAVGLVALLVGMAVVVGPWLALGAGGWLLYRWSRRRRRQARAVWAAAQGGGPAPAAGPAPEPGAPVAAQPEPAPTDRSTLDAETRLPEAQRTQAARIRRKAAALLARRSSFSAASRDLHVVERTLEEYLPATVTAYLALSPGAAASTPLPDGRTGRQALQDQLDILESRLDQVANDLWQVNVGRLLANERFLEEHVGPGPDGELTIPPAAPTRAESS